MLGTILSALGLTPARLIAGGLALAAVVGGTLWVRHQISTARQATADARLEASQAREDLERARGNLAVSEAANATSTETIRQLTTDRAEAARSVAKLETKTRADAAVIRDLRAAIDATRADPANQVTLSPVLADTVARVQADRDRREETK